MTGSPVAIDDIFHLRVPAGLRISPDGRCLLWTERRVDAEAGHTFSRLVLMREGREAAPFTRGQLLDVAARFSFDGRRIAFLRTPPSDGEPVETSLCVIPVDGGEARTLLSAKGSFGAPSWSPDGRWLALCFRRADEPPEDEKAPLSIRVNRLPYKLDGAGYLPQDRFRLYKVDTRSDAPELIPLSDLEADWDETDPVWSPDGSRLAFLANRRPERHRDIENLDLFVMPSDGGPATQCTLGRGSAAAPVWAPDGSWLAALLCPAPAGQPLFRKNVELFRVDPSGQTEEIPLTSDLDRCTMHLTIDDLWGIENWAPPPVFMAAGRRLLVSVSDEGSTQLLAVPLDDNGHRDGSLQRVVDDRIVVCFDAAPEADRVAFVTTSPTEPGLIEVCAGDGRERHVWAWPLHDYCAERVICEPIELRAGAPEGHDVHGWLLLPEGEGPFPLLVDIHGGPVVQFGNGFFHELQTFAARGYAVLLVNPRGSQGYGEAFVSAIHRDWGAPAMADIMTALDHVLAEHPLDPERLGVMGGSYGGYLTTWIIAHSHRFKAACVQRTVSSMEAMIWCDFGAVFGDELEAFSWDDPELYRRISPITYAEQIDTPVLILQGLADQRTPPDQGERLYVTLKLLGKQAELVLFPGGTHDLSRNGRPSQRIERLRVVHDFFDGHLGVV